MRSWPKPYYKDALITLYRGNALDFAGMRADSIITDPIWPNAMGIPAVGIEINRSYAKLAAEQLEKEPL